jgi:hypothetical protein
MSPALALAAVLSASTPARAAYSGSTAAYERLPQGARAAGLGGAFTAVADDATAIYWNPAGLSQGSLAIHAMTMAVSYAVLPQDRRLGFLAISRNVPDQGHFGIGLSHATAGRIPRVDSGGEVTGSLADSEDTLFLSASKRRAPNLAIGASVKLLFQQIGPYKAVGAGLDLGLHWQPSFERPYFVGVVAENLGSYLSWNTNAKDAAAPGLRVGQSHLFYQDRVRAALDLAASATAPVSLDARAGLEATLIPGIRLRAGFQAFRAQVSVGASFAVREYSMEYAATRALNDGTPLVHRAALTGKF